MGVGVGGGSKVTSGTLLWGGGGCCSAQCGRAVVLTKQHHTSAVGCNGARCETTADTV